ncbi:MAG: outer membrane lipoprotein-sorting protein [Deltaproteobacteria bacterium HGW-Deltaproteobacteria-22]|jgi:outer membrane lipoprotein-sorting protein|nr:MAG: outer membrane lipoprotein-sorting protein [Deltaproteobacteria bacterium HGW-Deltaproteobacteria-22]
MKKFLFVTLILILQTAFGRPAAAQNWGKCPKDTRDLVDKADRIMFAKTTAGKMTMTVRKPDQTSTMSMTFWSSGRDNMLVRITEPSRLKGMSTLKVSDNVWYYMPRTDRIVKVGSSMMGDSWMGSHFTNDDLVKETQLYIHYECLSRSDGKDSITVSLAPKPNAPVVWGKIVMKIRRADSIPESAQYYSDKGVLKRTMTFDRIQKMDGRSIPTRMTLTVAGKNESTEVVYDKVRFDVAIPDRMFTLRGLKM